MIIGSHMPREDLAVTRYFACYTNQARAAAVVYAKSLWEEPKGLDLLAFT
jgi:hypothetical protein